MQGAQWAGPFFEPFSRRQLHAIQALLRGLSVMEGRHRRIEVSSGQLLYCKVCKGRVETLISTRNLSFTLLA